MYIGSKNTKHLYTLDNSTLTPVAEEMDLGYISTNLWSLAYIVLNLHQKLIPCLG